MADELLSPDDIPTISPRETRSDIRRIRPTMSPPWAEIPAWNDERFPPRLADFVPSSHSPRKLVIALTGYGVYLTTSLIAFVIVAATYSELMTIDAYKRYLVSFYAIYDSVDTLLVLLIVALTWKPPTMPGAIGPRWTAWLAAGPILALMLTINTGYHSLIRLLANQKPEAWDYASDLELSDGWPAILFICIQPGIVEELLFRFVILGHLRSYLNLHASVWITAGLFGLAHIGETISMPILVLIGAFFGYSRVWSRSMALPILLHFSHNYFVLLFNEWDKARQIITGF